MVLSLLAPRKQSLLDRSSDAWNIAAYIWESLKKKKKKENWFILTVLICFSKWEWESWYLTQVLFHWIVHWSVK